MQSISQLVERALAQINAAETPAALDQVRVQYLGRSGELTLQLKTLGSLPAAERKEFGQVVNAAKVQLEDALKQRVEVLGSMSATIVGGSSFTATLEISRKPDVTLPGR